MDGIAALLAWSGVAASTIPVTPPPNARARQHAIMVHLWCMDYSLPKGGMRGARRRKRIDVFLRVVTRRVGYPSVRFGKPDRDAGHDTVPGRDKVIRDCAA